MYSFSGFFCKLFNNGITALYILSILAWIFSTCAVAASVEPDASFNLLSTLVIDLEKTKLEGTISYVYPALGTRLETLLRGT